MKKTSFITSCMFVCALFCTITSFGQIKVVNNNVLIGTNLYGGPDYTLDVRGNGYFSCSPAPCGFYFTTTMENTDYVATLLPQWSNSVRIGASGQQLYQLYTKYLYVNGVYVTSDVKTKENIRPMESTLDKMNKLNLIKFDYKDDYFLKNTEKSNPFMNDLIKSQKNNSGFLAQDVEKIYPNLVQYSKDEDLLRINYLGFIPEFAKAIQELSAEDEQLKSEITYLKSNCCNNNSDYKSDNINDNGKALLYQNTPNPFTSNTTISFFIPKSVKTADLYIYNLNGVQIIHSLITSREQGSYTLNGNDLEAGMYIYTLVTDNNIIDSKRMILTK